MQNKIGVDKKFNEFEDGVEQEEFLNLCDVSHTKMGKILDISKFSILIEVIKNLTFWGFPHELSDLYIGNFYFG
jgi:hypothetical protein